MQSKKTWMIKVMIKKEMPDLAVGNKKLNKHIQFQCEYSLRTEYIGSYAKYSVLHCFI